MLMESRKLYLNPYIESVTVFPEMVTSVTDLSLEIEPIEIPWPPEHLLFLKLVDTSGECPLSRIE